MGPVARLSREYWFGPVSAARPYLLLKGVLFLLAFDAWAVMMEHGGRYGIGGFNVTHFELLDAVQPVPSSAFYVGLIAFVGLLAFTLAFARSHLWSLAALAVLYSYGWMMSMLDSYQHHYLLSIVLVGVVFFPRLVAGDVFGRIEDDLAKRPAKKNKSKSKSKKKRTKSKKKTTAARTATRTEASNAPQPSWAYYLVCWSCAVVYIYTAVSKTEHDWRMGTALQNIGGAKIVPIEDFFLGTFGFSPDTFWWLVGHSVIVVQIVIASGYLAAPLVDRKNLAARIAQAVCGVAFVGAWSFHWGAEWLELQIGWFSYYMLIISAVCFLPRVAIFWIGWTLTWPARALAGVFRELDRRDAAKRSEGKPGDASSIVPMVLGVALVVGLAGWAVDMPGALPACIVSAVVVVTGSMFLLTRKRGTEARPFIAGLALAAALMWVCVASTDVRWSYYRKVGGVYRRHGNGALAQGDTDRARELLGRSLEAYEKTNLYAPHGEACDAGSPCEPGQRCEEGECTGDRQAREDEVRAALEGLGG